MTGWVLGGILLLVLVATATAAIVALVFVRRSNAPALTAPACPSCGKEMRPFTQVSARGVAADTWMLRATDPTHWRCPDCKTKVPYRSDGVAQADASNT